MLCRFFEKAFFAFAFAAALFWILLVNKHKKTIANKKPRQGCIFVSLETGEPHKLEAKDVSHEDEDSEQQKDSYFFPYLADSKTILMVG